MTELGLEFADWGVCWDWWLRCTMAPGVYGGPQRCTVAMGWRSLPRTVNYNLLLWPQSPISATVELLLILLFERFTSVVLQSYLRVTHEMRE